jgi:uncharacterized Zn finger protein
MSKRAKKDFKDITWDDLELWAGHKIVSRGRAYQRSKTVRELAVTDSGEIVAWVDGSTTYATRVSLDNGEISSICTCPYHSACKHAVAVILEYLNCLETGRTVPRAEKEDERLTLLGQENEYDLSDNEAESYHSASTSSFEETGLDGFLKKQSKSELLKLIRGILEQYYEVREELEYKVRMTSAKTPSLVKTVEREITNAAREPGWWSYREHRGYIPDYSRVRAGLQRLLDEKHADEVLRLGEKLLSLGIAQVEQSHDEGDTAGEIAESMKIVFKALKESSLPDAEKMERAVDFSLRDEYDLCYGIEEFWKQKFSKKDWGYLADRLLNRLNDIKAEKQEDSFSRNYRRDRLTDEIIKALKSAGRNEEAIALCLKEAEITCSYDRLVKELQNAGRDAEAEEWIRKGIAATLNKWPGIASSLKNALLDMRKRRKDWNFATALLADNFFDEPSLNAFKELQKAAERAQVWQPVKDAVMHFLKTGERPRQNSSEWPMPDTGIEKSSRSRLKDLPMTTILIEIAIYEKRVDDVLKWYDVHKKRRHGWRMEGLEDNVAEAIAHEYPDKAVEIWKRLAESHISITNVSSYIEGAKFLRRVKSTMGKNKKANEWDTYLQLLKENNRRKPRLIEILDALSDKPIIRVQK